MSYYTSENTHVLATHMQAGNNERMLLFHICENGRHEYIIGSYFHKVKTELPCYFMPLHDNREHKVTLGTRRITAYEWDWGHYFGSFEQAAMYWLREVCGLHIHDEEGELI